jgi:predicted porin
MKAKCRLGLGAMVTAIVYTSPAAAQVEAEMEVYGTLLPFVENVGTFGATPPGTMSQAYQAQSGSFTGINHDRRFRMTAGTSHLGFRGGLPLGSELKLIWQIESPAPIDGEGPSNWANRNSHAGFTGGWGTLIYGNWDTPMRWVTVTSVNPIKGGYTGDMTPIIGSPGHSTPAWNSDQTFIALIEVPPNRAGFFRHEANSVQYWSPTLAGFSLRAMFAANEHRTAGIPSPAPGIPPTELGLNPYLVSGYIGYDNEWLRIRYAAELHNDYFGMANLVGQGPALNAPSSTDIGHLALASVKINAGTEYETRVVATGDLLSYHTDVTSAGVGLTNEFSRAAIYALAQQKLGSNNIWGSYGMATEGSCNVTGPGNESLCTTKGLGATYYTLGYMYEFTQSASIYGLGYALFNDVSARYTPFPLLDSRAASDASRPNLGEISYGSDSIGVGIGFVYSFNAKLLGDAKAPPAKAEATPPGKADAPLAETPPSPQVKAASEGAAPAAPEETSPPPDASDTTPAIP